MSQAPDTWEKPWPAELEEAFEGALLADGFDRALIGFGTQFNRNLAIYDLDACVAILVEQGMTPDEAQEYLDFNTLGAWVGESTPVFVHVRVEAPRG